jgi:hypothetical protein
VVGFIRHFIYRGEIDFMPRTSVSFTFQNGYTKESDRDIIRPLFFTVMYFFTLLLFSFFPFFEDLLAILQKKQTILVRIITIM